MGLLCCFRVYIWFAYPDVSLWWSSVQQTPLLRPSGQAHGCDCWNSTVVMNNQLMVLTTLYQLPYGITHVPWACQSSSLVLQWQASANRQHTDSTPQQFLLAGAQFWNLHEHKRERESERERERQRERERDRETERERERDQLIADNPLWSKAKNLPNNSKVVSMDCQIFARRLEGWLSQTLWYQRLITIWHWKRNT